MVPLFQSNSINIVACDTHGVCVYSSYTYPKVHEEARKVIC